LEAFRTAGISEFETASPSPLAKASKETSEVGIDFLTPLISEATATLTESLCSFQLKAALSAVRKGWRRAAK
jgi:hypothetical protein